MKIISHPVITVYLRNFIKLLILKSDLHKLYIENFQLGEMPRSMQQAVISCLCKRGDREGITNWRPILLLNYDNKIFTRILASKIQPTCPKQTAAIKVKTIIENMQLNQDVMSYANANKIQAAMIALDQEKAFDDRVDWSFLFKALYF